MHRQPELEAFLAEYIGSDELTFDYRAAFVDKGEVKGEVGGA